MVNSWETFSKFLPILFWENIFGKETEKPKKLKQEKNAKETVRVRGDGGRKKETINETKENEKCEEEEKKTRKK